MAMDSPAKNNELFPFFKLPRELRDRIYDGLIEKREICPKNHRKRTHPRVELERLVPHARLVGCRFKAEAEAQTCKVLNLNIITFLHCRDLDTLDLTWDLSKITHLHYSVRTLASVVQEEVIDYRSWSCRVRFIQRLAQSLRSLKAIRVGFSLKACWYFCEVTDLSNFCKGKPHRETQKWVYVLVAIPVCKSIVIRTDDFNGDKNTDLWAEWSRETGWRFGTMEVSKLCEDEPTDEEEEDEDPKEDATQERGQGEKDTDEGRNDDEEMDDGETDDGEIDEGASDDGEVHWE